MSTLNPPIDSALTREPVSVFKQEHRQIYYQKYRHEYLLFTTQLPAQIEDVWLPQLLVTGDASQSIRFV
jgi:hypothetical protein